MKIAIKIDPAQEKVWKKGERGEHGVEKPIGFKKMRTTGGVKHFKILTFKTEIGFMFSG
jgi:hypothetical protein